MESQWTLLISVQEPFGIHCKRPACLDSELGAGSGGVLVAVCGRRVAPISLYTHHTPV